MSIDARLSLVLLAVEDVPRALSFYRAAFEWPLLVHVPVYAELQMDGGQRLGLYQHEGFGRNTGRRVTLVAAGQTTGAELYFHTSDPAALADRLQAVGAELLDPLRTRDWGDEAAYLADPDGNVLVVARALAQADDVHRSA